MNWNKILENLRDQTAWYTKQANDYDTRSGYHEQARQYRTCANVASILASALHAGLASGQ